MPRKSGYDIQSMARGLDILTLLVESDRALGVTEIAQVMDVDKSTAFRLLSTLASRGFVVQDQDSRRYLPGLEIVHLSRRILDRTELRAVAKPWLKQLQQATGESAHLAVTNGNRVVYLDTAETGAALNVNTEIGRHAPVHCTAIGKALIALMPPHDLETFIGDGGLTRYTPATITTLPDLIAHLEIVRARGYAMDDEEFDPGVRCVAAPIRDYRGKVVAAVGISGPALRVTLDRIPDLGHMVLAAAEEIRQIGHRQA